jgi:lysylphosphatidylglycerol synthetase-like protein (DUF2156 family)
VVVALVVFLALVAATIHAVVRPGWVAVLVTVVVAVAWLPADSPVEGWVLLTLSHTHGITVADLAGVVAGIIAVACWAAHPSPAKSQRHREASDPAGPTDRGDSDSSLVG